MIKLPPEVAYSVFLGEFPFREKLGEVYVLCNDNREDEAKAALACAIEIFGGHPVVCPA